MEKRGWIATVVAGTVAGCMLLFAGLLNAEVTLKGGRVVTVGGKEYQVYEVGEKGTVEVKEPAGFSYKKHKDIKRINTTITGAGVFDVEAEKSPSSKIDDSGVEVRFHQAGEPEKKEDAMCTVVKVLMYDAGVAYFCDVINGITCEYVVINFEGKVSPIGLGTVSVTATPSKGNWTPDLWVGIAQLRVSGDFSGLSTIDYQGGGSPVGTVLFSFYATYAGVRSNTFPSIVVWGDRS